MAENNGQQQVLNPYGPSSGVGRTRLPDGGDVNTAIYCNGADRFASLYDPPAHTLGKEPIRLNIGAGHTEIPGYTPVDRLFGQEAYPLDYPNCSVDEIRASHVLEHFPIQQVPDVLKEWSRVLRHGGRMRIAVPDWEWLRREQRDPLLVNYVYGGQTDDNDFHKCGFNEPTLKAAMEAVGIGSVKRWPHDFPDCSSHPCSLNLEGFKGGIPPYKTAFVQSLPRLSFTIIAGCIYESAAPFGLPVIMGQGAYWQQVLENSLEDAIEGGYEWAITHDYDTAFGMNHMRRLFDQFEANPFMDALAPLQPMRNNDQGLVGMERGQVLRVQYDRPFPVRTAHFGLTIIRLAALKTMPKPWFLSKPSINNDWREFRTDADIYFWEQWKKENRTLFLDPGCKVGHLEEVIAHYDDDMQIRRSKPDEWRIANGCGPSGSRKAK